MSYAHSHVILIAFALDTPDSLENVSSKACLSTILNLSNPVLTF